MTTITAADVDQLSYIELLARLSESNRPPGGVDTIRRMIGATGLRPGTRVLHAGCNAGFLSRELVRRTGCRIVGIDISPHMVAAARDRAAAEGVGDLVEYVHADMRRLPFDDGSFDVVLSAGALAFVAGRREEAIAEWQRVVRPHGVLADAELFYVTPPPPELLRAVSDTIGVEVPRYDLAYWRQLFTAPTLEPYYEHVSTASMARSAGEVETYARRLITFAGARVAADAGEALLDRLVRTFGTLNDNMAHLGHLVTVHTYRPPGSEPVLYA